MKRLLALILAVLTLLPCILTACISREAAELQQGGAAVEVSDPENQLHTVTFYQDGTELQQVTVPHGARLSQYPQGFDWRDESGASVDVATLTVMEDMKLYVREQIDVLAKHVMYLGCEDKLFHPEENVTRGQLAQIMDMLLSQDEDNKTTTTNTASEAAFSDVTAADECYAAVARISELGLMHGNGDGLFRPDDPVTRAELVTVLCRLMDVPETVALAFPDVTQDHWAMGSVAAAMTSGWLNGFDDGNFYPDKPVTKAEAVVLINRARGRQANKNAISVVCKTSPYRDVSPKNWAYYDIVDAAYMNELLAYIYGEVEGLQQGFLLIGEQLCHVNADLKLDFMEEGFHTFTDKLDTDGLYFAPENGYFLRRSTVGLQEFDGSMFYAEVADGPLKTDFDLGYLYFGPNGRYTTTSDELDGYVDAIMEPIIQGDSSNLLNETKLREAYDYIINGGFDYMSRAVGWQRGTTAWAFECARDMFASKRGPCFYWAAAFLFLARRLGYQAYPICGGVNENNALHAWVMIDENGIEYIYDVELDWAYRTGAHGRVSIRPGRNLFKQRRGASLVTYIFPGDTWAAPPKDDTDALGTEVDPNLYLDENGNGLVAGVDYTVSYTDNGDGTYTVTITYLTGSRTGTTVSTTLRGSPPEETPAPPVNPEDPGAMGGDPAENATPTPAGDPGGTGGEGTGTGGEGTGTGGEGTGTGGEGTGTGGEGTGTGGEGTGTGGEGTGTGGEGTGTGGEGTGGTGGEGTGTGGEGTGTGGEGTGTGGEGTGTGGEGGGTGGEGGGTGGSEGGGTGGSEGGGAGGSEGGGE